MIVPKSRSRQVVMPGDAAVALSLSLRFAIIVVVSMIIIECDDDEKLIP